MFIVENGPKNNAITVAHPIKMIVAIFIVIVASFECFI